MVGYRDAIRHLKRASEKMERLFYAVHYPYGVNNVRNVSAFESKKDALRYIGDMSGKSRNDAGYCELVRARDLTRAELYAARRDYRYAAKLTKQIDADMLRLSEAQYG